MKLIFWLLLKDFSSLRRGSQLTSFLAVFAMGLGVASLLVSMAVVSSYTSALKSTVVETFGDILVLASKATLENQKEMIAQVESVGGEIQAYTPFVNFEAITAQKGVVTGVLLQGVDPKSVEDVLNLSSRLLEGSLQLDSVKGLPSIVIGSRLAKKLKIRLGDSLNVIIPSQNKKDSFDVNPKLQKFSVQGIISYGRYDYDTRYMITDIFTAQKLASMGTRINGFRIKLKDNSKADVLSEKVNQLVIEGSSFWSVSWKKLNSNLFAAIEYEKVILFFILLIIVVAACFNIASTLFVNVFSRFRDISVLKALGVSKRTIRHLFVLQGLILGFAGYVFGLILGVGFYWSFIQAQNKWHLLDAQVYKIENLRFELYFVDLLAIFLASMLICCISTLSPATRGANLVPTKGLRYE